MRRSRQIIAFSIGLMLTACGEKAVQTPAPTFFGDTNPDTLSAWNILDVEDGTLKPHISSDVYELESALFSDYALKLRTIYMPDGTQAKIGPDGDRLEFPIGTIITKSFYYPKGGADDHVMKSEKAEEAQKSIKLTDHKLIETRLLVHRENGWDALPYVWNDDQTEATLKRTGDIRKLTLIDGPEKTDFAYMVPDVNQCAGCHATNNTTRKVVPIGPKLRHLKSIDNLSLDITPENYLKNVAYTDQSVSVDKRARAYLDINCSHCHNEVGPADTSGLHLESHTKFGPNLGYCKTPIAAGTGTGNRKYGIVPSEPDESIFIYRMASTNPAVMMPELGRSLAHQEGVELISDWISEMEGSCG